MDMQTEYHESIMKEIDWTKIPCHSCHSLNNAILFECPLCHFMMCKRCNSDYSYMNKGVCPDCIKLKEKTK